MIKKIINDIVTKDLKNIAILTHKYPDYDAICSANALAEIIYQGVVDYKNPQRKKNILDGNFEISSRVPDNWTLLFPIVEKANIGEYMLSSVTLLTEGKDFSKLMQQISFDAVIVCDVNEQDRIFGREILDNVSNENIYLFDHHMGNRKELDILPENKLVEKASSTCEIILKDALNERIDISNRAMKDLYAGVVTDTCDFLFGVNDFTFTIKNDDIYGFKRQEKEKIENIFGKLYEEDEYNLQHLNKIDNIAQGLDIYFINNPKTTKKRGTYINSALEKAIMPGDNSISVLFAIYDGYTEIKFRKGKNSSIMISDLAKAFNGGGNEDRSAARVQGKSLDELIEDLLNNIDHLSNQGGLSSEESMVYQNKLNR